MAEREGLETALARVRFFVEAEDREWIVRYPAEPLATLELVPLSVASMAGELLSEAADLIVLSSAFLGHRQALAECFGLDESRLRSFASDSPFPLDQRRIEYRPVGALSKATLARLEPVLFAEVAAILAEHPREKGLIHAPSYAAGRRLVAHLAASEPMLSRRLIWVESTEAKTRALELHRASPMPTVLVRRRCRKGWTWGRLPALQIVTKLPTRISATRGPRSPSARSRWYALETARPSCRPMASRAGTPRTTIVTHILDGRSSASPTTACSCRRGSSTRAPPPRAPSGYVVRVQIAPRESARRRRRHDPRA
jgi:hypothetical protein